MMRTLPWVLVLLAVPAQAATLKPATILHAPVVRLDDLFTDAGPEAARVLGPGPRPGGQIVVEAAQLAYIARRYGVDWRPGAGPDRAVLERPGRQLTEAEVLGPLRAALTAAGASAECEVQLSGFTPPLVPAEATVSPVVSSLQYDRAGHRFAAVLTIAGVGQEKQAVPLNGRVEDTEQVPVAVGRLAAGTVLRREDLRLAWVRSSQLTGDVARGIDDAVGMQVRSGVAAGQPLARAELEAPILVRKGARVAMRLDGPGISLTGEGVALESGAAGERVRVQNVASRAVVDAEVINQNMVRVTPGRPPLTPAAARALGVAAR